MNIATNNTTTGESPRLLLSKPTDTEIAIAVDSLRAEVCDLRIAALVCDEYVSGELQGSKFGDCNSSQPYRLEREQVNGILYMTDHVRYLGISLEQAIDKAFGQGGEA